jgi:hypothetical protein
MKKGYTKLVVSCAVAPRYELIENHHATVWFGAKEDNADIGKTTKITILKEWYNDRIGIQAVEAIIHDVASTNTKQHITISRREGSPAKLSNEMLAADDSIETEWLDGRELELEVVFHAFGS